MGSIKKMQKTNKWTVFGSDGKMVGVYASEARAKRGLKLHEEKSKKKAPRRGTK